MFEVAVETADDAATDVRVAAGAFTCPFCAAERRVGARIHAGALREAHAAKAKLLAHLTAY